MRQVDLRTSATWAKLSPSQRRHIEHRAIKTDILAKQIEIYLYRVRLETAMVQVDRERRKTVTDEKKPPPRNPKLRGLIQKMDMFHHEVDKDIEEAAKHLEAAHDRRKEVFKTVHTRIDSNVADLDGTVEGLDDLEAAALGDNGAPLGSDSENSDKDSKT